MHQHLIMKRFWLLLTLLLLVLSYPLFSQQPDGKFVEHYASGKIKTKGFYHYGQKQKLWMYYSEDGKLTLKEKWKAGKLLWKAEYEDGRLSRLIDKDGNVKTKSKCGC
jgi:antitoxin component YwqK of YwqJK toxin-antitoxin module